jgi:hypothetical protein
VETELEVEGVLEARDHGARQLLVDARDEERAFRRVGDDARDHEPCRGEQDEADEQARAQRHREAQRLGRRNE